MHSMLGMNGVQELEIRGRKRTGATARNHKFHGKYPKGGCRGDRRNNRRWTGA